MEEQVKKYVYIKGLLVRLILCCIIFLILFGMNVAQIEIFGVTTQKIVRMSANNTVVDQMENFFTGIVNYFR